MAIIILISMYVTKKLDKEPKEVGVTDEKKKEFFQHLIW
jgi:hypothetical protein